MPDSSRYRRALVLARGGALTPLTQTRSSVPPRRFTVSDLPAFHRAAPDLREWPVHQYGAIG